MLGSSPGHDPGGVALPQRRGHAPVRALGRPHRHRRVGPPRPCRTAGLDSGLPPPLPASGPSPAPEGAAASRVTRTTQRHPGLALGQLVRTGGPRDVRHPLCRPPRSAPTAVARRLARPPPAQGVPRPGHRACPLPQAPRPTVPARPSGRDPRPPGSGRSSAGQHRPPSLQHPRRAAHRARPLRRRDQRLRPRDRQPPQGGGEDRRAAVLAPVHPLHRSGRLPERGGQQPLLSHCRGDPGRHPGAGAGPVYPGAAV